MQVPPIAHYFFIKKENVQSKHGDINVTWCMSLLEQIIYLTQTHALSDDFQPLLSFSAQTFSVYANYKLKQFVNLKIKPLRNISLLQKSFENVEKWETLFFTTFGAVLNLHRRFARQLKLENKSKCINRSKENKAQLYARASENKSTD